jgi:hypothetical protein
MSRLPIPLFLHYVVLLFLCSSFGASRELHPNATIAQPIFGRDLEQEYGTIIDDFMGDPTCPSGPVESGLQIAVASYINPIADPPAWNRLINYPTSKMPILVANVVNGPDTVIDKDWKGVIDRAAGSGKTVIGYVRTGYLGLSQHKYTTRLGKIDLASWAAQIEQDVDIWYELYGSNMGGIFFDEGWPECGPDDVYAKLYKHINDYTKRTHPGAFTVLNPGSPTAHCYEDTMDTLLTFESSYESYTTAYVPNDWVPKDPRKLWHIIYKVPETAIGEVAKLARQRGVGLIEITDDVMDNPYDNLPHESYMQSHLSAVDGGVPLNNGPSSWPSGSAAGVTSGLAGSTTDYSSAGLSWNAASNSLGYNVYLKRGGGAWRVAASIPKTMTSITIAGLQPGSTNVFRVSAIGGGGVEGSTSNEVTISTKALPDGKAVGNQSVSPKGSTTTYKADIYVPYAFVRLFIWDAVECDFDENPGWTVNFKTDAYVCTHYMVEGTTLYKYTGTVPAGSNAPPWVWTSMGTITLEIKDYTYTWTLPIGTSTTDTSKFVVQAQGYGPFINTFSPEPSDYDCKGSSMCTTPDFLKWCDHAVNTLQRSDTFFYTNS